MMTAEKQAFDEVLKRMLGTPPTPYKTPNTKAKKPKERAIAKKKGLKPAR